MILLYFTSTIKQSLGKKLPDTNQMTCHVTNKNIVLVRPTESVISKNIVFGVTKVNLELT